MIPLGIRNECHLKGVDRGPRGFCASTEAALWLPGMLVMRVITLLPSQASSFGW